eukprot:scaffold47073_cov59-Attheya_sp.AAC.3
MGAADDVLEDELRAEASSPIGDDYISSASEEESSDEEEEIINVPSRAGATKTWSPYVSINRHKRYASILTDEVIFDDFDKYF